MADTELFMAAQRFSRSLPDRKQQFAYLLQHAQWCDKSTKPEYSNDCVKKLVTYIAKEFARGDDFRNDVRLIDVYSLVAKTSRSMGLKQVFEQVYELKNLCQVARFYVTWAGIHASDGNFSKVEDIRRKAIENGAQPAEHLVAEFERMLSSNHQADNTMLLVAPTTVVEPRNVDCEMEVDENVAPIAVPESQKRTSRRSTPLAAISEMSNENVVVEEVEEKKKGAPPPTNASAFFPENACGAFSNTLPLSQEAKATASAEPAPAKPAPQKAAFQIYYDPATPAPIAPLGSSNPGAFLTLSACSDDGGFLDMDVDEEKFRNDIRSRASAAHTGRPLEADDVTLASYNKVERFSNGPVTSTPFMAPQQLVQSAFAAFEEEDAIEVGNDDLFAQNSMAWPKSALKKGSAIEAEEYDGERTGAGLNTTIIGDLDPWNDALRKKVLNSTASPSCQLHFPEKKCQSIVIGREMPLGEASFSVLSMLGQGGFARVYKVTKKGSPKQLALKFESPACPWEVYMCETARRRLKDDPMRDYVMFVHEAYIFANASAILYEYYPHGTLLDLANDYKKAGAEMSPVVVMILGLQIAHILRAVHAAELIHGDVKPDNFVISGPMDQALLSDPMGHSVVKLIDWGRGIDMRQFRGRTFQGRAGTEAFDCPEMLDGREWTFQTDFFGFIAVVYLLSLGEYVSTVKNNGRYAVTKQLKRRFKCRQMWTEFMEEILNIPSCAQLPDWNDLVARMQSQFQESISADDVDCRKAVERFNALLRKGH
ncbi:hypothetical protein QR680_009400 [Steinernema hermaphroditum]|uniref:Protein kinase domain-containing protein n=1 Tax=Steinernema hermaphroditum TaxID=289476 RepID=A0AA39IK36_9BILA|nr:hypothetical protein QR680_009400 [Steinernema hermaphroditum]